jgi:hypothetical protein
VIILGITKTGTFEGDVQVQLGNYTIGCRDYPKEEDLDRWMEGLDLWLGDETTQDEVDSEVRERTTSMKRINTIFVSVGSVPGIVFIVLLCINLFCCDLDLNVWLCNRIPGGGDRCDP